jgi:hypothetical protein
MKPLSSDMAAFKKRCGSRYVRQVFKISDEWPWGGAMPPHAPIQFDLCGIVRGVKPISAV